MDLTAIGMMGIYVILGFLALVALGFAIMWFIEHGVQMHIPDFNSPWENFFMKIALFFMAIVVFLLIRRFT